MYGDDAQKLGRKREAGDDAIMFGFYIWNNVRIGFQTFAGGILFGLGALFYLLFNGLYIGTVTGYVVHAGFATNFFSFTSGHSAFELTAIALCGAAGLRLGYGLVAPGRLRRGDALRLAAREAMPLVIGAACMLVLAAAIEAFWSPRTEIPPPVKYAVGGVLWAGDAGVLHADGARPCSLTGWPCSCGCATPGKRSIWASPWSRTWARTVYAAWLTLFVPLCVLALLVLPWQWAIVLVWWLKPALDRVVLHVLASRRVRRAAAVARHLARAAARAHARPDRLAHLVPLLPGALLQSAGVAARAPDRAPRRASAAGNCIGARAATRCG